MSSSMLHGKTVIAAISLVMFGVLLAMVTVPIGTDAADSVEIGDYLFDLDDTNQTAYLHLYKGSDTSVSIPSKVAYDSVDYTVTVVGYLAFEGNDKLASVTIPSSVKMLDESAFANCPMLSSVVLSEGLEEISIAAFKDCPKIVSMNIPGTVKTIGNYAFAGTALSSFIMPDAVTKLGAHAFENCRSLTSVTLSRNITTIANDLFYRCESLKSVQIPNGVTSIGGGAFDCCYALESANIPNGVTSIGNYAFNDCYKLNSVSIPNSVTILGDYAFNECKSMKTLTIGSKVNKIGFCAFDHCESLESVVIPSSVKSIDYTFNGCKSLKQVTFSEGLQDLGGFNNCSSLVSIVLPNSLTSIGSAFSICANLTSISIGSGLADLGKYRLFVDCPLLSELTVSSNNPNFKSVDNVLYTKHGKTLLLYPMGKTDKSYSVLEGTVCIYDEAFYQNNYIETIIMPTGLREIGEYAFITCLSIKCMSFPDSLVAIGIYPTSMTFYLENVQVNETVDVLKGRTWNGNGDRKLYCFETSVFTVSFKSEDTVVEEIQTGKNGMLSKEMPIPTNPGYSFKGWYDSIPGGNQITEGWVFTKDTSVYALWEKADVPVTGVSIDTPQVTLTIGESTVLSAEIKPSNATDQSVTWESSDTSVATVDQNGYVHSVSVGKAEITVTTHDGGFKAKATIDVVAQPSPGGGGDNLWIIIVVIVIIAVIAVAFYWKRTHY